MTLCPPENLNLAVLNLVAKLPNYNTRQIFQLHGITSVQTRCGQEAAVIINKPCLGFCAYLWVGDNLFRQVVCMCVILHPPTNKIDSTHFYINYSPKEHCQKSELPSTLSNN